MVCVSEVVVGRRIWIKASQSARQQDLLESDGVHKNRQCEGERKESSRKGEEGEEEGKRQHAKQRPHNKRHHQSHMSTASSGSHANTQDSHSRLTSSHFAGQGEFHVPQAKEVADAVPHVTEAERQGNQGFSHSRVTRSRG